jgi:hypothetical protein
MKKRIQARSSTAPQARDQLNRLMEAMAFVIAQRQMKRHWAVGHRATLPSII